MDYDLIIIGSGPAGYVAAIRAGQMGIKTAIIEKENVGGMCLNWGCIPSKSVIESAKLFRKIKQDAETFGVDGLDQDKIKFNWKQATRRANDIVSKLTHGVSYLLKKNGVDIIKGEAKINADKSVSVANRKLHAKNIVIATGSVSPALKANLPEDKVMNIKNLWQTEELPQNIVVVGQNAVAVELAQFFKMSGRTVSLVAPSEHILPLADKYLSDFMLRKLKKDGIKLITNAEVNAETSTLENGRLIIGDEQLSCDLVINAKTRTAVLPDSEPDFEMENGFLKVDEYNRTSIEGIFAIGDVNGRSFYAHIGSAQGLHTVNYIKGIKEPMDYNKYPLNMYSDPEIAQIGRTEEQLQEEGIDYKVSQFPLSANGKAMAEGTKEGFIRMLSEKKYGQVLGVQIAAPNATDMIAEASAFMAVESTVYDVARTVHAHPTISEVFMEAGFDAIDHALHI